MSRKRNFKHALVKARAYVRELPNHVGYRAARPPYHYPENVLLNGRGALTDIGRFDGTMELPTLYLSASPTAVVREVGYAEEQHGRFVKHNKARDGKVVHATYPLCIIPVRVRLERVLHVNEALGCLPIDEEELYDPYHDLKARAKEYVPVHELARAVRENGIEGILYFSRHEHESQNLAVFLENVASSRLSALYGKSGLCGDSANPGVSP